MVLSKMKYKLRKVNGYVEFRLTKRWTPKMATLFLEGRADRLVLSDDSGFAEPDLEFLRGLPIRDLCVVSYRQRDLEPIHSLAPTLESLQLIAAPLQQIDLSSFEHLNYVGADWAQVSESIGAATGLRTLYLERYRGKDLAPFSTLSNLERLTMKDWPSIKSLHGLSALPKLKDLGIFIGRYLEDISELEGNTVLEELQLSTCKRVSSFDHVAQCTELRLLNMAESGDFDSLAPLSNLSKLKELILYGGTKILDGDLSPLLELPNLEDLRMQNRRHYKPSVPEIEEYLLGKLDKEKRKYYGR